MLCQSPSPPPSARPTVVLVHGLGRSSRSMRPLERAAAARGYRVVNVGYPSRTGGVEAHAAHLAARLRAEAPDGQLHVVTHSLGGIVLRHAVAEGLVPATRVARVVMLAPPNQGSEVADAFSGGPVLRRVGRVALGPAGAQLATAPAAFVRKLPPVPFELAVIAGTRSLNPFFSWLIPGPDDGKVGVGRAGVSGMRVFLTVPHTHTFIMRSPRVIAATFAFLEHGAAGPPAAPSREAPRD